jgi:hypothetical protein
MMSAIIGSVIAIIVVAFLASNDAGWVTNQNLRVNGGIA